MNIVLINGRTKMKILAIYDDVRFSDRYTVYFDQKERNNMYSCLTMSINPFHPMGIGQHSSGMLGKHNGKKINFDQLPIDCQNLVLEEMKQ